MTLNQEIYQKVRQILFNKYAYPDIEQIQPEITFQMELAVDSLEMYELMDEFQETFDIIISRDDIDDFIFQPQDIKYVSDIKCLTIQNAVDYIEQQMLARKKLQALEGSNQNYFRKKHALTPR